MNALKRARQALGFTRLGGDADFVGIVEPVNPRFFVVPDALKAEPVPVEPVDISETIANAAKENTAMTEPHKTMTESYRGSLEMHKATITDTRARIVGETEAATAEHNAQIERLNDEIKSRNEAHAEYVKGQNERLADADKTLGAINASLDNLDGRIPKGQRPVAVPKPATPAPGEPPLTE